MALDRDDQVVISSVGLVSGIISMLGSLTIIGLYILLPAMRNFKARLVVYLSIASFLWTLSVCIGLGLFLVFPEEQKANNDKFIDNIPCQVQAFFLQWFIISHDFWIALISIYLYLIIVRRKDIKRYEWVFHVICWGIPFIIATLPFGGAGDGYGIAGTWCWVVEPLARLWFSYLFVWMTFFTIAVFYSLIVLYTRKSSQAVENYLSEEQRKSKNRHDRKLFKKLALFPLVYLIQWIPATINRIQNAADPDNPITALFVIHLLVLLGGGGFNIVVYGSYNRKTLALYPPFNKCLSTSENTTASNNSSTNMDYSISPTNSNHNHNKKEIIDSGTINVELHSEDGNNNNEKNNKPKESQWRVANVSVKEEDDSSIIHYRATGEWKIAQVTN